MIEYESKPLVSIVCESFNHDKYLRDCLEGFVMQKTTFPFEILIHDDASKDGSQTIIKEYCNKYPWLFKPILQQENQYSKGISVWHTYQFPRARGKYIAICEGDDCWTDPLKIQKQADYMESHPECALCVTDAVIQTSKECLDWSRYKKSCVVPTEDVITGGGLFFQTASYMFRNGLQSSLPECGRKSHVGDYPLALWCALNGSVYYMSEKMVTYRYGYGWTKSFDRETLKKKVTAWKSEIDMLNGFDECSHFKHHEAYVKRIGDFIYSIIKSNLQDYQMLKHAFEDDYKRVSLFRRMKLYVRFHKAK